MIYYKNKKIQPSHGGLLRTLKIVQEETVRSSQLQYLRLRNVTGQFFIFICADKQTITRDPRERDWVIQSKSHIFQLFVGAPAAVCIDSWQGRCGMISHCGDEIIILIGWK